LVEVGKFRLLCLISSEKIAKSSLLEADSAEESG